MTSDNRPISDDDPRRKMDSVYRGGIITLIIAFLLQGVGVLIYAGRLDQRVIHLEETVYQTSDYDARIINNTLQSGLNKDTLNKMMLLLEKINERQRSIELKLEHLIK